jgi:hypothetical protein
VLSSFFKEAMSVARIISQTLRPIGDHRADHETTFGFGCMDGNETAPWRVGDELAVTRVTDRSPQHLVQSGGPGAGGAQRRARNKLEGL